MNLYAYVHNNPFQYTDPDGLFVFALPLVQVTFGVAVNAVLLPALKYTVGAVVVGYLGWKAGEWINKDDQTNENEENQEQALEDKTKKRPPYCGEKIGNDATKPPAEGFEWKGRGAPETGKGKGSWVKDDGLPTQESLRPDFDHPPPTPPHWDYHGPNKERARLNLDGTWEWK